MRTMLPALGLLATLFTLGGCYKSDFEAQKKRADDLDSQLASAKNEAASARSDADNLKRKYGKFDALVAAADANDLKLVTIVDGKPDGIDQLRFDSSNRAFVRHGVRSRSTSDIRFENGRIADQIVTVKRANGKTYFTGGTKNSMPDGEWLWYNNDGKPTNKEVWKDGHLAELFKAGATGKDGNPTWTAQSKGDREKWFTDKNIIFINLPELTRLSGAPNTPAPALPAPGAKPATGAPTTPAAAPGTKPATKPAPAKPAR